jgi:hypothetical protein
MEIVPERALARELNNACANFDWALAMLDNLVLPLRNFRIALVGVAFDAK